MAFVGIDPSITSTGIVILDDDAKVVSTHMILSAKASKDWVERTRTIKAVHREFRKFLRNANEENALDIIVLEDYSYGSRFQSHQLGELGFGFRRFLQEYYRECAFVVPPKRLTKFVTGNGNDSKDKVARVIRDLYGLEFENNHLSDACACALFALALADIKEDFFLESQLKMAKQHAKR